MKTFRTILIILIVLALPGILSACTSTGDPADWLYNFFAGYSAEELYLFVVAIGTGLIQALWPAFSLFEWIKKLLKIEDKTAHRVIVGLSMILGTFILWVTKTLGLSSLTFDLKTIVETFGFVYVFSQIGYKEKYG